MKTILMKQAERHKKTATGRMCAFWVSRMADGTGKLADVMAGTVPVEDTILLNVSETSGTLSEGLVYLGHNILALKQTINNIIGITIVAVSLLVIVLLYLTAQAFVFLPDMFKSMATTIDIHTLGDNTEAALSFVEFWQAWGFVCLIVITATISAIVFSLKRLTGDFRKWLDKYILPYQLYRFFNSALFVSTLAGITKKISGKNVVALKSALMEIHGPAYPWLKWQSAKMIYNLEHLDQDNTSTSEIFNTGLLDQSIYYRVLDIGDYETDISELMSQISEIILEETPKQIDSKVKKWRVILIVFVVMLMVGFYLMSMGVNDEFTTAIQVSNV